MLATKASKHGGVLITPLLGLLDLWRTLETPPTLGGLLWHLLWADFQDLTPWVSQPNLYMAEFEESSLGGL